MRTNPSQSGKVELVAAANRLCSADLEVTAWAASTELYFAARSGDFGKLLRAPHPVSSLGNTPRAA